MSDGIKPIYVEYLKKYMRFYRELQSGKRVPQTPLQQNFVEFIRGKTQRAKTIHAKAFRAYLMNSSLYDKHLKDAAETIRASKDRLSTKNNAPLNVVRFTQPPYGTLDAAEWAPSTASEADMCSALVHVRFTPNSDRESGHPQEFMSALPPKADMCTAPVHVC